MLKKLLVVAVIPFILTVLAFAQPNDVYQPEPASSNVEVYLDDTQVTFPDREPFIDINNRTLVPIRFIAEDMGAEVTWDEAEYVVGIELDETVIELSIGERRALVGDAWVEFDTRTGIYVDRTMVPLRFVSETLGAEVSWDGASRRVDVRTKEEPSSTVLKSAELIPQNSRYNLVIGFPVELDEFPRPEEFELKRKIDGVTEKDFEYPGGRSSTGKDRNFVFEDIPMPVVEKDVEVAYIVHLRGDLITSNTVQAEGTPMPGKIQVESVEVDEALGAPEKTNVYIVFNWPPDEHLKHGSVEFERRIDGEINTNFEDHIGITSWNEERKTLIYYSVSLPEETTSGQSIVYRANYNDTGWVESDSYIVP